MTSAPRVERAHQTLQDRLVKELRLRGIDSIDAGNAFLPEFAADYDTRFARPPADLHYAHRALRPGDDLEEIFRRKEQRKLTANLTIRAHPAVQRRRLPARDFLASLCLIRDDATPGGRRALDQQRDGHDDLPLDGREAIVGCTNR